MTAPILEVKNLKKYYPLRNEWWRAGTRWSRAVEDVSFVLHHGEALGIVGESGSGKSTLIRTVMRLIEPTSGSITYEDRDLRKLSKSDLRKWRQEAQLVFQDPYASLNPHYTVEQTVLEPMAIHGLYSRRERKERVAELLTRVGLNYNLAGGYPDQFSGGQRQRIGIARALAMNPKLLFLDEPVASLDVSVQAQVLNLLDDLKRDLHLSYVFVAHDLSVVRYLCDRVIVMSQGRMVEMAETDELFRNPLHAYTRSLLAAIPVPDPDRKMTQFEFREDDIPKIKLVSRKMKSSRDNEHLEEAKTVWKEVAPDHYVSRAASGT